MSLTYHIDVCCDQCGAVLAYAAISTRTRPNWRKAIDRARGTGWSHSIVRDLCPTCRPRPRNRLHHRKTP